MQRLAKPSDYVPIDILGRPSYVLPWESRLCPGNPTDDPAEGALLYNEFACASAQGVTQQSPAEQVALIIDWTLGTPGEAARSLATDLAAAYQGKYQFRMDDLQLWDDETKAHRGHLVFHNNDIRELSAQAIMSLRSRAATPSL
jgi:hypothetical protein